MDPRPTMPARILAVLATAALAILGTAGTARADTLRLSFVHTVSDGDYSVIASGAIADGGVAHVRNGRGKLWLRDGTIRMRTRHDEPKVHVDPKTCIGEVTETGTYRIVGGMGAYAGISGSGRFRGRYRAVGRRKDGTCAPGKHPAAAQVILKAKGPVTLAPPDLS